MKRAVKRKILSFILVFIMCFSSVSSSFFAPVQVKASTGALAALDWFLTLLAASGYSYATKDSANSGFEAFKEFLADNYTSVGSYKTAEELKAAFPWFDFSSDVYSDNVAELDKYLGYINKSTFQDKAAALEAYPGIDVARANKLTVGFMRSWVAERFPTVEEASLGVFNNAFSRFTPFAELTEPAAILLTQAIPSGLKDYKFGRCVANAINSHYYSYTAPTTSRFFVSVSRFGISDYRVHVSVGELPDDARYFNISNATYSSDGVNFTKLKYKWYCYPSGINASQDSEINWTTAKDRDISFWGNNFYVAGNGVVSDYVDSDVSLVGICGITFNSVENLTFLDADLNVVSSSSDDIVKIADAASEVIPSDAVSADTIIDTTVAALEAGAGKAEAYDFSAVAEAIAAGNEQNHEDNEQQLAKLGLISSLLAELFDFLKNNSLDVLNSISGLGTTLKAMSSDLSKLVGIPAIVNNVYEFLKSNIAGATTFLSGINDVALDIYKCVSTFDIAGLTDVIKGIDSGVLSSISHAATDTIPGAIDNLAALINVLPIDSIAENVGSIPSILGIDIVNAITDVSDGISGLRDAVDVASQPVVDALDALGIGVIAESIQGILSRVVSISDVVTAERVETPENNDVNLFNVLFALIQILILLLKIFLDCLIFITAIFNIPAEPYFLNEGMIQGLDWLKNTEITGLGISIYGFLMSLITIIVIFSVVGTLKRHIHKIRIR